MKSLKEKFEKIGLLKLIIILLISFFCLQILIKVINEMIFRSSINTAYHSIMKEEQDINNSRKKAELADKEIDKKFDESFRAVHQTEKSADDSFKKMAESLNR